MTDATRPSTVTMSASLTAAVELAAPRPASQHAHWSPSMQLSQYLQMQCLMRNGPILAQRAMCNDVPWCQHYVRAAPGHGMSRGSHREARGALSAAAPSYAPSPAGALSEPTGPKFEGHDPCILRLYTTRLPPPAATLSIGPATAVTGDHTSTTRYLFKHSCPIYRSM